MSKQISSTQNPLIKQLFKLQEKSRERRKTNQFVIEGLREISLALKSQYNIESLLFVPEIVSIETLRATLSYFEELDLIEITKEVYDKIAYRGGTEGVIALVESKKHLLQDLKLSQNPFILIAEAPEKPGNIGALLRTADAANVDAFIIANPKSDLYNPNIIRSSVGGLFTNQVGIGTTSEIIAYLKELHINFYCAALREDAKDYTAANYTKPTAIVVGTEATGLSEEWLTNATQNIIIPMKGKIDSMNVSVSAGILVYEVVRQRGINN